MEAMNLRPLGDRVIVEREKSDEKIGRIHIPDSAQAKANTGKVVAVGPGRILESGIRVEPTVKVGDRVLLDRYAGDEVGGRVAVRESAIVGILDPKES